MKTENFMYLLERSQFEMLAYLERFEIPHTAILDLLVDYFCSNKPSQTLNSFEFNAKKIKFNIVHLKTLLHHPVHNLKF